MWKKRLVKFLKESWCCFPRFRSCMSVENLIV